MFIGHFTEPPWQDDKSSLAGQSTTTLDISNRLYDPEIGSNLYNRYLAPELECPDEFARIVEEFSVRS